MSPAHSRGNIWDATLSQWSNLCGILEEAEPEVDLVDDNQEIQAEAEDEFFGTIHSDIVGVRYYKGSVSLPGGKPLSCCYEPACLFMKERHL